MNSLFRKTVARTVYHRAKFDNVNKFPLHRGILRRNYSAEGHIGTSCFNFPTVRLQLPDSEETNPKMG